MKKIGVILIASLFLASCAMPGISNLLGLATSTPILPPTPVPTITSTFTPIPTQPTPTFTLTPTLVGLKTPTITVTPGEGTQPLILPTNTNLVFLPTQVLDGFAYINLSVREFYIGDCEPSEVKFTAQAANAYATAFVVLFVRFKSITTGATGPWTDIAMINNGAGTFAYTLVPDEMKGVNSFQNPWVQYQLVAADANGGQIGRTQIFDELLALKNCPLTPFPTATSTP
jgi:hypothetical protein